MEEKPKRGGRREGAGRKPKASQLLRVGMRITQETYDILHQQENMTAYIEEAVREKYEREKPR